MFWFSSLAIKAYSLKLKLWFVKLISFLPLEITKKKNNGKYIN
jgi:hypothetical protein